MFTNTVGPVGVFFYWPEAVIGNLYWPGASGSLVVPTRYIYIYMIFIYVMILCSF